MKKASLIIVVFIFLIVGCRSLGPVFNKNTEKMEVSIPLKSFELLIEDTRENVSNRTIYLTPITFGGEHDSISSSLPLDLEKSLSRIVNDFKTEGQKNIRFAVSITEGYQKFRSNGIMEVEFVEVELTVKAFDMTNGMLIDEAIGKSWGDKRVVNATYKRINKMYSTAFHQAFRTALGKLEI